MSALEFGLLGPLSVNRDGAPVEVGPRKERTVLLCLLLDVNAVVTTDRISEQVWGDCPPATAKKLIQLYVSHLRERLGRDSIATVPGGYRAEIAPEALDSTRFETLLRDGRAALAAGNAQLAQALFGRALGLWRGPALADLAYDEVAAAEAARLEELRIDCLEERLSALLALGENDEALAEATRLSTTYPQRERLRAIHMVALYRAGRQVEALAVFRDARRALLDQLGLEPGDDLRAVERAILRQDPSLAPAAATPPDPGPRLPAPMTALIGRDRELALLRDLVQRPDVRLLTLAGAGGSGKTRLALAVATECRGLFANGVAVAELGALADPSLVLATTAEALEVGLEGNGSVLDELVGWAQGRELLLVLDNFEHLLSAAPEVVRLVQSCPRLKVLVTSRRVLHVTGEQVFPVDPLALDDASVLFALRAGARDPRASVSADDPDVRAICKHLDGLPLAIELAAARSPTLTPPQLRARLGERLTLLAGGPRDLPARQQTLRATIDWSADLLDDAGRTLLARFAAFPGDASLEATLTVTGCGLDALQSLVHDSMLRRDGNGERARFSMLETMREYALDLLGTGREEAAAAHARYFAGLAESAELRGPAQMRWLETLGEEQHNLRAALDHAAAVGDAELELRLAVALWRYWWLRGYLAEGRARLENALARTPPGSAALRANAYRAVAGLAWAQGHLPTARERGEAGLELAAAHGARTVELACHTVLGLVATAERDFPRARHHLEASRAIAASIGSEEDELVAKMNLGVLAFDAGDPAAAVVLWSDVLDHHRSNGNVEGEGFALLNLGLAAYRLDEMDAAEERFRAAAALFESIGFKERLAHALQGLAAVAADAGRDREAAAALGRAAVLLDETGAGGDGFEAELAREVERALRSRLGDAEFVAAYTDGTR
jgi:predicted ATPase/DNA-binding SARP family transcriptional activator